MAGNGLQNPDLNFEQLYEQARTAMPQLQDAGAKMLADLRQHHPGLFDNVTFEMGPLKAADRAQAKIAGDYAGDTSQISDLARARLVVDTPEQISAIRDYLDHNASALGIEKSKDRFAVPSETHFRDINMKARMPNGHVVELRIEQSDLLQAAKHTHTPYERIQEIERRAEMEGRDMTPDEVEQRARYMDEIHDIHDAPSNRAGLDSLLNETGKQRLEAHALERSARTGTVPTLALAVTEEFGRRAGVVGGLVVGGVLAYEGASAADITLGAAEAAIPGVASAAALAEGRPTESAIRGIEEFPLIGLAATELARPLARFAGFDVDPSIGQLLLNRERSIDPQQAQFIRIFDALPRSADESMSPEAASLVEMKQAILQGEMNLTASANPQDRQKTLTAIETVEGQYTHIYEMIDHAGGLDQLEQSLTKYAEPVTRSELSEQASPGKLHMPVLSVR